MRKLILALSIMAGLVLAPLAVTEVQKLLARSTTAQVISKAYKEQALPPQTTAIEEDSAPKVLDVKKTLILEEANIVTLKGPVTEESVSDVEKKLQAISHKLSKNTDIYLVLDTPGGDIPAGMDLIDFCKALPQKVHTITLFAASMGFQIAQNLDTRYIVRSGTSMSHRARISGLGGQVKGELETRYKSVRRIVDFLDIIASQRLGLDLKTYEGKIFNEMWVYGFDSLNEKVADEVVLLKCGSSMNGIYYQNYDTMFGQVRVGFNKCPLIKAPESIEMGGVQPGEKAKVEQVVRMSISNQEEFVREFIVTDRFNTIFK